MSHALMFKASVLGAALCFGASSAGCYAEATTGATVTAAYEPAHIEVYPHEYYDGRVVYLVGDRWYYREGPRWVYYVREPQVLVERRVVIRRGHTVRQSTVVHEAPPARHERRIEHRERRRADRHRAPSAD